MAKLLSVPLDQAIVLLPEAIASMRAAAANRLQNSINLVVGSAIASIGLTVPTVAVVALLASKTIVLVHLVIFAVFIHLAAAA